MGLLLLSEGLRYLRFPDRLAPLLPDPAPEGQFRVSVEYRRDGIVTGRDEMALTTVDGWLHAEGVRSYFALRPEDVRRLKIDSTTQVDLSRRARFVLSDGGEIWLSRIDDLADVALSRWHRPRESMAGEPTFPPARVHPQELARWTSWMAMGLVCMFLSLGLRLLFGSSLAEMTSYVLLAIGGFVVWFGSSRLHDLSVSSYQALREDREIETPTSPTERAPPLPEGPEALTAKRL